MKPLVSPQAFARLMVRKGSKPIPKKELFSVRIDADVLAWFRALGDGYQSRMNALLRAYMEENEKTTKTTKMTKTTKKATAL